MISYIFFKFILSAHPSTNEVAFNNTFTDIINNTFRYTSTFSEDKSILYLILDVFIIFKQELFTTFSNINYYSFLISTSMLLNFVNIKNKQSIFFNLSCIFSFFLITSINGLRGSNSSYYIFSDFFLILSFTSFSNIFNKKFYVLLIPILVIIYFLNYPIIKGIILPQDKIQVLCNDTYFYDWHKNISPQRFKQFCNNNL